MAGIQKIHTLRHNRVPSESVVTMDTFPYSIPELSCILCTMRKGLVTTSDQSSQSALKAPRDPNPAGAVCGAVSTFGFAFYIQPVLMPMIAEMPRGKYGVKMLGWSNRFVVLGE